MNHSIGDGLIVASFMAAFIAYFYFSHRGKLRRLELIHQERLAAMDKGIPLPELPIDPPAKVSSPYTVLIHGIAWSALSIGGMIALYWTLPADMHDFWVAPLPLAFLGIGLMLYCVLTRKLVR